MQPARIPHALEISGRAEIDGATGGRDGEDLVHDLAREAGQVHRRGVDHQPHPQALARVAQHLVHERLHSRCAAQDHVGIPRVVGSHPQLVLGAVHDHAKGRSKVVAQHAEHQVARAVHLGHEELERFGQCLIHRLVEAGHVLEVVHRDIRGGGAPQAQDRGPQGPVLRHHLVHFEPAARALHGMGPRRRLGELGVANRHAVRARQLLVLALWPEHVVRDLGEDACRVVAQRKLGHAARHRDPGAGEGHPVAKDRLDVGGDECGKLHGSPDQWTGAMRPVMWDAR